MRIRTVTGFILLLLFAHAAHAGTTRLFGQGCGGDLVDSNGTLPAVLSGSASAPCVVGGGTTGSSSGCCRSLRGGVQ